MTFPKAKVAGLWICTDSAQRDAIGSEEGLQVDDLCIKLDNRTYHIATSVDGPNASTWIQVNTEFEDVMVHGQSGNVSITANPAGDIIFTPNGGSSTNVTQATAALNQSGQTDDAVIAGQPLYTKISGTLGLARADSIATARVFGLALEDKAALQSVSVGVRGPVTRTDWTPVAGTALLNVASFYYLSPDNFGQITTIAPEATGNVVVRVGRATTANTLDVIDIQCILL